jgi:hypothetical protein
MILRVQVALDAHICKARLPPRSLQRTHCCTAVFEFRTWHRVTFNLGLFRILLVAAIDRPRLLSCKEPGLCSFCQGCGTAAGSIGTLPVLLLWWWTCTGVHAWCVTLYLEGSAGKAFQARSVTLGHVKVHVLSTTALHYFRATLCPKPAQITTPVPSVTFTAKITTEAAQLVAAVAAPPV